MPPHPIPDMAEIARLTKGGHLKDAMALLKRVVPQVSDLERVATPALSGLAKGLGALRPVEAVAPLRDFAKTLGSLRPGAAGNASAHQAPASDGARFTLRTFSCAAGSRDYKLYVPAAAQHGPLPLVVMLHGCQQSPDDFATGTRMNALADEQGFIVAYPGQPSSANPSRCWNWFSAGDQQREKGEPALIAGITRQIMAEANVDPARVYVAGLSAGGAEAAILGATYPDLYAAIGVHSGLACGAAKDMSSAFMAMRQGGAFVQASNGQATPTIVFHGDGDHTVSPVNGDQVITQARAASTLRATVTQGRSDGNVSYTRTVQADRAGRPVLEHWLLHGAGHAWSGGSSAGSFTEPRGPDASREMLRFFAQHHGVTLAAAAE